MSPYARVEVFTSAERAARICDVLLGAASIGTRGDGIIAVEPVESVVRIRSRSLILPHEI